MKKKSIIVGIIVIIAIVISIYFFSQSEVLGNINGSYTNQTTKTSEVSFLGEGGDRIKFSFKSNVESGDLDITLYNSAGKEVYKLDKAKEGETFFTLDNSDTYRLVAECNNFIGKYKIKVSK